MVRAPCCEKLGVKKGPWSNQEDQILISYVTNYGHSNWRALPILAGLKRCGKSCRLRWINYLRPDIKRGSFSQEEEDNIIRLHKLMGNRWSAIASKLPERTDNEIKNVWHTYLKKRVDSQEATNLRSLENPKLECSNSVTHSKINNSCNASVSPQPSSSDLSSVTDSSVRNDNTKIDEFFWEKEFNCETSTMLDASNDDKFEFESNLFDLENDLKEDNNEMAFWYDLLMKAEELLELTGF